jgi:hypothetical protein
MLEVGGGGAQQQGYRRQQQWQQKRRTMGGTCGGCAVFFYFNLILIHFFLTITTTNTECRVNGVRSLAARHIQGLLSLLLSLMCRRPCQRVVLYLSPLLFTLLSLFQLLSPSPLTTFFPLALLVDCLYTTIAFDNTGLNLSISANSFSRALLFCISSDLPIECWSSSRCSSHLMHFRLL